ncbi:iron-containing redox enzyme family protein [Rheinheimera sp. YQF-2]|uniref:Iron-containing redox enzyme family protein n=1 Tax=Rheinheimera lutimaris TaxID=2740584 RepID=A0A7Y5AP45_9GAMM|nr:iron-containing redox enzyme family protein [Rheinheimera lutimaris]NRQ41902.1 iron-containing redox enzyme family protein [Rheinheimera lutimaris]
MNFYQSLLEATSEERNYLLSAPMIKRCFEGDFTLDHYVAFLLQAYHHVKHTVPLLMAVGAQLPEEKEWLREAVAEYIEEELGHQEWVLNDIAACGFDKEQARQSAPLFATEMMVSYAYDAIRRTNPLAFFGMVLVLEGTSINLAEQAASHIAGKLGLPRKAFSYLNSHGALDQEHIKFYENLMNNISSAQDQAVIVHAAKRFYRLYGDIFRSLEAPHGLQRQEQAA